MIKKALLLNLLTVFTLTIKSESVVSKIYCQVLGNQDLCSNYQDVVRLALRNCGVHDYQNVAIKKMNQVGPLFALAPLASFTAFGIWFDETYLNSCSQEERVFQIYHEVAHYAQHHHQKILAVTAGISSVMLASLLLLNKKLKEGRQSQALAITLGAGAVATIFNYLILLPALVKQQEKSADLIAAKNLIALDGSQIVEQYIQVLKHNQNLDSKYLWWPSNQQQIDYLSASLNIKG